MCVCVQEFGSIPARSLYVASSGLQECLVPSKSFERLRLCLLDSDRCDSPRYHHSVAALWNTFGNLSP